MAPSTTSTITLRVNGEQHTLPVDHRTTLLDALRERLDRVRNEPDRGPVSGHPFSSRNLIACFRKGARRFGLDGPRPTARYAPGRTLADRYRHRGVQLHRAGRAVHVRGDGGGGRHLHRAHRRLRHRNGGADRAHPARRRRAPRGAGPGPGPYRGQRLRPGRSRCRLNGHPLLGLGRQHRHRGTAEAAEPGRGHPAGSITVRSDTTAAIIALAQQEAKERHTFGAQFAEVAVDPATGEVRVRRMLGVFAAGRIVNPLTAHGQFIGGMVWGISMALHEEATLDPATGGLVSADLAGYHFSANADVPAIEAYWVNDPDPDDPVGIKGIGEVGNVGAAAAIANAVWHATGVRHRHLPIRPDRVLTEGAPSA